MARFSVTYDVIGSMTETIEAESLEVAKARAEDKAYDDNTEFDLDTIDDVRVSVREMHHVIRDGRKVWTTYVLKSDERVEV
jgi:hypothetical protein